MAENTSRQWAKDTSSRYTKKKPAFASSSRTSTAKGDRWIGASPRDPYASHRNEVLAKRNRFTRGKADAFQWKTKDEETGAWIDLDGPANAAVQAALNSRSSAVKLPRKLHRGRCYIDLRRKRYYNTRTGEERPVRQDPSEHTGAVGSTFAQHARVRRTDTKVCGRIIFYFIPTYD